MQRIAILAFLPLLPLPAQEPVSESSSATHRVVVVDGRTVVDERTVDGVVAPRGAPRAGLGIGRTPAADPDAMVRDLLDRIGEGLPPDARRRVLESLRAGAGAPGAASSRSSHTRRVVVRNGEVVVDEETIDGRPVRGAAPRLGGLGGVGGDGAARARAEARAEASSTDSSSSGEHAEDGGGTASGPGVVPARPPAVPSAPRELRPRARPAEPRPTPAAPRHGGEPTRPLPVPGVAPTRPSRPDRR